MMLRTIRSTRLRTKIELSYLCGVEKLLVKNFNGSCSTKLKNTVSSSKDTVFTRNFSNESFWQKTKNRGNLGIFQDKDRLKTIILDQLASQRGEFNWDKIIEKGIEAGIPTISDRETVVNNIVEICEAEKLSKAFKSFFKYVIESKGLNMALLHFFCKAITSDREHFHSSETIVYKILQQLHHSQCVGVEICCSVLLFSSQYREKVLLNHEEDLKRMILSQLIISSLHFNDEARAFGYLEICNGMRLESLFTHFLTYFQKLVDAGVVPFSQVVTLFDQYCKRKLYVFLENNKIILDDFVKNVNKIDSSHYWSIVKTDISSDRCVTCHNLLQKSTVTHEEIEKIRNHLLENVIFETNINIRSNHGEWKSFINYLQKMSYDIVLDGLNLFYFFRKSTSLFIRFIKALENLELTPLILARKHFKQYPGYEVVRKTYPVFLTEDISHDDVFVLYAAFLKGKDCYAVSRDVMSFARERLSQVKLDDAFLRWQASHQCYATNKGDLVLPLGFPYGYMKTQLKEDDEFQYHLVMREGILTSIYCFSCLRKY